MTVRQTIAVVGGGEIGRSTIGHLLAHLPNLRIHVFDGRAAALGQAARLDPDRVTAHETRVDASAASRLGDCDLVLNTAGPFYRAGSGEVARVAAAAGCRYVDICDDAEGARSLKAAQVASHGALLTGAGMSPGISNVWARRLIDLVPGADGIDIAWVVRASDPGGLAALQHLLHMAVAPCPQYLDGALVEGAGFVPETARRMSFPEPIGMAEVYHAPHPEPLTLPEALPNLRRVRCFGGILPEWANSFFSTAARLGFVSTDPALMPDDLPATDPVEVLWQVLSRRDQARGARPAEGYCALKVVAFAGDEVAAEVDLFDDAPMARATGLGAAAIAVEALTARLPAGAWGPEVLDAERTLATLTTMSERAGAFRRRDVSMVTS